MMNIYSIHAPTIDVVVALRCEAERARREGFPNTAKRQDALALHLENADIQMRDICPPGHQIQLTFRLEAVPTINPVLDPKFR